MKRSVFTRIAPRIGLGTLAAADRLAQSVPSAQLGFDVALVDYMYADAASVRRWEANHAHPYVMLSVDRGKSPDGGWRVGYQPAIIHDDGEGWRWYDARPSYRAAPGVMSSYPLQAAGS